ncbi:MAG: rhamnulokinase [Ruminococcaceae bacterium]|nr:rhamnulokinase [Oscillospiraceae bacterium]
MKKVLSFDFGASSGRAMLATLIDGKIEMQEIHRFSNDPVVVNGRMYWDVLRLFFEIKAGITKAVNNGGFDAIGIDTWGVDFGMLDKNGRLLCNPVHYRDTRTEGIPEKVFEIIPKDELYSLCGTQLMNFNTIYQLMYLKLYEPELLELTDKILLIPDLFAYMLTGVMRAEATNVSTTNLFDPYKRDWNREIIKKLGLPEGIFPDVIEAGEELGLLSDEICEELGCPKVPVIAVPTHDTASAVVATPSLSDDFVYISCGTWSLFGIENETPILTQAAADANFTNEGGFKGTTRFLKNIMGLWLIQESRRQWRREGVEVGFDTLEHEALAAEPFRCFIDVDNGSFAPAGNLPRRVKEFCERTGQYVPKTRGEIMRCIYQSLAMKYKYTFNGLHSLTGKDYNRINMLGGGIKDKLLCQLTADACGCEVLAGPTEATVMGNIAVAYYALGEIEDFKAIRQTVINSTDLKQYLPTNSEAWDKAYEDYKKIIGK